MVTQKVDKFNHSWEKVWVLHDNCHEVLVVHVNRSQPSFGVNTIDLVHFVDVGSIISSLVIFYISSAANWRALGPQDRRCSTPSSILWSDLDPSLAEEICPKCRSHMCSSGLGKLRSSSRCVIDFSEIDTSFLQFCICLTLSFAFTTWCLLIW